jgi:hypothetical protein
MDNAARLESQGYQRCGKEIRQAKWRAGSWQKGRQEYKKTPC